MMYLLTSTQARRVALLAIDLLLLCLAWSLAYQLRFEFSIPTDLDSNYRSQAFMIMPWIVGTHLVLFYAFHLYRGMVRYVGTAELRTILIATCINLAFWGLFSFWVETRETFFQLPLTNVTSTSGNVLRIPIGVLGMYFFISIIFTGGFRFSRRLWVESRARYDENAQATLVVGAGNVADAALRELGRSDRSPYRPVAAVSVEKNRVGTTLQGVPVRGGIERIPELLRELEIGSVLIALDEDDPETLRDVVRYCQNAQVEFQIVPTMRDITGGRVDVRPIRRVRIEDLLGREPVRLELPPEGNYLKGETVLITGAGGSIGSELARQVLRCEPARLVLLGRGENSIHTVYQELSAEPVETELIPWIADTRDETAMQVFFERHKPTVVFHAAAHKHVPLMEVQPEEAVKNNVLGTAVVAFLAHLNGAKRFVLISTDKAVRPVGAMGATKRMAERVIFSLAAESNTIFQAVRFGNVLGSRGSAKEIFENQIARGGPVTVTHPEVTRFFMTIPEAVSLVLRAGLHAESGSLFLLEMGKPVRIVDLVRQLITLSGKREGQDIEIRYTGLRPGEKLHEDLLTEQEGAEATEIDKVWAAKPSGVPPWKEVQALLKTLRELAEDGQRGPLLKKLHEAVPDYSPADVETADPAASAREAADGIRAAMTARQAKKSAQDSGTALGDQGDLFAEETGEPETDPPKSEDEDAAAGGEALTTAPSDVQEAEPAEAGGGITAETLSMLEGNGEALPEDGKFPSVEIAQPDFSGGETDPKTKEEVENAGRPEAEAPESDQDPAADEEILKTDFLSALSGSEAAGIQPLDSGDLFMTQQFGNTGSETVAPVVFLALLDGASDAFRREFFEDLASKTGTDSHLILAGGGSVDEVPEGLRERVAVLPPHIDTPPKRYNKAMEMAPKQGFVVSLTPDVRLHDDFLERLRAKFAENADCPLVYADHIESKGGATETVKLHDHEGCPHERFEFGPVIAYRVAKVREVGGFKEDYKYAWEYDLHLRLMDDGRFLRLDGPAYTVVQPAEEETKSGQLYSPGKGPLGGFSYVFYPEDMDKEVTEAFEKALKRWGAWLDNPTSTRPEPSEKPEVMASVVIPVLNRQKFIGNAIEKVLEGTYDDFEVIVVDNGSSDGTVDVVKELSEKDARVRLIHGTGSSIASALNEGIRAARGKYICQLDSDDQYDPTTLEKMVGHLESHPKCGLAISYYRLMDENAQVIEDVAPITHNGYSRNQILRRDGAGALRVFPKAVLEEFGLYDEEHYGNFGEDYDMVLKTGEKYDVDRVHEVLYYYRRHGDNTDVIRAPEMKYKNKNRARQEGLRRRKEINRKLAAE